MICPWVICYLSFIILSDSLLIYGFSQYNLASSSSLSLLSSSYLSLYLLPCSIKSSSLLDFDLSGLWDSSCWSDCLTGEAAAILDLPRCLAMSYGLKVCCCISWSSLFLSSSFVKWAFSSCNILPFWYNLAPILRSSSSWASAPLAFGDLIYLLMCSFYLSLCCSSASLFSFSMACIVF